MSERVENALNETRILVLVVQVLIGFQFEGLFTKQFEHLAHERQATMLVALGLQILVLALLLTPPAYHRIVFAGNLCPELPELATKVMFPVLLLFACAVGIQVTILAAKIVNDGAAIAVGVSLTLLALCFWYGIELLERARRRAAEPALMKPEGGREGGANDQEMKKDTPLKEKIKFALTETRVVLPGAQAMLGFQLTAILSEPFSSLPDSMKRLHLVSLACVAVCTILLMAPAAYHRIVEHGESSEQVERFTGHMLLAALVFLSLGLAGDFYVAVQKVFSSDAIAACAAIASLVVSCGLWFGYTLYARTRPDRSIIVVSHVTSGGSGQTS